MTKRYKHLIEISESDLRTLVNLLCLPPSSNPSGQPLTTWLTSQTALITAAAFPKTLLRPKRLWQSLQINIAAPANHNAALEGISHILHLPEVAVLCTTHAALNPWLIRRIFSVVVDEVTARLERVRLYEGPLKTGEIRAFLARVEALGALWIAPRAFQRVNAASIGDGLDQEDEVPRVRGHVHVTSHCEACILGSIGSQAQALCDIRAAIQARIKPKKKKRDGDCDHRDADRDQEKSSDRHPTTRWARDAYAAIDADADRGKQGMLRLVTRWIECFGGENADVLCEQSDRLGRRIRRIERSVAKLAEHGRVVDGKGDGRIGVDHDSDGVDNAAAIDKARAMSRPESRASYHQPTIESETESPDHTAQDEYEGTWEETERVTTRIGDWMASRLSRRHPNHAPQKLKDQRNAALDIVMDWSEVHPAFRTPLRFRGPQGHPGKKGESDPVATAAAAETKGPKNKYELEDDVLASVKTSFPRASSAAHADGVHAPWRLSQHLAAIASVSAEDDDEGDDELDQQKARLKAARASITTRFPRGTQNTRRSSWTTIVPPPSSTIGPSKPPERSRSRSHLHSHSHTHSHSRSHSHRPTTSSNHHHNKSHATRFLGYAAATDTNNLPTKAGKKPPSRYAKIAHQADVDAELAAEKRKHDEEREGRERELARLRGHLSMGSVYSEDFFGRGGRGGRV